MMAIYGLIALMAVSFIGWALAECKYKTFGYEKTDLKEQLKVNGYKELSIRDILKDGSFSGFAAI